MNVKNKGRFQNPKPGGNFVTDTEGASNKVLAVDTVDLQNHIPQPLPTGKFWGALFGRQL